MNSGLEIIDYDETMNFESGKYYILLQLISGTSYLVSSEQEYVLTPNVVSLLFEKIKENIEIEMSFKINSNRYKYKTFGTIDIFKDEVQKNKDDEIKFYSSDELENNKELFIYNVIIGITKELTKNIIMLVKDTETYISGIYGLTTSITILELERFKEVLTKFRLLPFLPNLENDYIFDNVNNALLIGRLIQNIDYFKYSYLYTGQDLTFFKYLATKLFVSIIKNTYLYNQNITQINLEDYDINLLNEQLISIIINELGKIFNLNNILVSFSFLHCVNDLSAENKTDVCFYFYLFLNSMYNSGVRNISILFNYNNNCLMDDIKIHKFLCENKDFNLKRIVARE